MNDPPSRLPDPEVDPTKHHRACDYPLKTCTCAELDRRPQPNVAPKAPIYVCGICRHLTDAHDHNGCKVKGCRCGRPRP